MTTSSPNSKNIVITGGNSGIGLQVARALYGEGHHILFGSRNEQRNAQAVSSVQASHPQSVGSVASFKLDLSQRKSISEFADFIKGKFKHIDILVNNSGFMASERRVNEDNIEMGMAVNHFGHFYLTYLLFPLIKDVAEGRIVNTSSSGHLFAKKDRNPADDLPAEQDFASMENYFKSKLANVMFTAGLAERLSKNNLKAKTVSLHPGVVETGFAATSDNCLVKFMMCCCCCCTKTSQGGAESTLHVCRVNFGELLSGEYYDSDCKVVEKHPMATVKAEVDKLWAVSEKVYGIEFNAA